MDLLQIAGLPRVSRNAYVIILRCTYRISLILLSIKGVIMKNLNIIFNLLSFPFLFFKKLNTNHFVMIFLILIFTNGQVYAACSAYPNEAKCIADSTCVWYDNGGNNKGCIDAPTPPSISGIPDQTVAVNTVFTALNL